MQLILKNLAAGFCLLVSAAAYAVPRNGPAIVPPSEQTPLITSAHVRTIYRQLVENHWVPDTGLFLSFLGTQDNKLVQQASTYEQAAVGLIAVRLGDIPRA